MKRAAFVALASFSLLAAAETYQGQVVGVTDGDTITVLDSSRHQHEVRLAGIDAPEKRQAYGQASKQHLSELVFGRQVTIKTRKRDRYKRELGKVLVDDQDAGLNQIESGLAWHYKKYARNQSAQDRQAYAAAEDGAKLSRKGLWKDADPIPPWDFRHQRR